MSDLSETSSNCNMDTSTITSKAEGDMREDPNSIHAIPPGPLRNIRALNNAIGLSPMSEIAFLVSDNLVLNNNGGSTPVTAKAKPRFIVIADNIEIDNAVDKDNVDVDNMDNIDEQDERLTSNFQINSAGISPATRLREQRSRGAQRRLNIAPQLVNFDIKCESPTKMTEDISFYSGNSPQSSPRPCPISPCMDDDSSLLSPETSPSKFNIDSHTAELIRHRLHSHNDTTSMDSGYSATNSNSFDNQAVNASNNNNNLSLMNVAPTRFEFVEPCHAPSMLRRALLSDVTSTITSGISSPTSHKTPSKYLMSMGENSNGSTSSNTSSSTRMGNGFKVFHSLSSGSMESMDEDYMDLIEMENMDEDAQLPTDLSSLICKDIKSTTKTPENKRPSFVRKCLNLDNSNSSMRSSLFTPSPKSSTITSLITTPERQCLQSISENITPFSQRNANGGAFKRPEPPAMSPIQSKRYKCENDAPQMLLPFNNPTVIVTNSAPRRPAFKKSMSMNDAVIMNALSRSTSEPNLIGDFSKPYCLPLIDGRHSDLRSINAQTMNQLLNGAFDDSVASYKVIDCRYPYEFDGGHIQGALNLYTQEQILEELVMKKTDMPAVTADGHKRHILVFHCEFSSERGPKLSRFLRNHDRMSNTDSYPALHYPEVYLLHGGYKEFFESNSTLCQPELYRPMLEPQYNEEYKVFRAKSKSWTGDVRASASNRLTKSRSRLVL